jgi:SecD/SecF fusion protein
MQNKGLVRFLVACLIVVCAFYLSFSFVTRIYDNRAKEYGQEQAMVDGVVNDSLAKIKEAYYLDSIATKTVWCWHTLKECREREIGLGLDLKGGMNVTMEVSVPDILDALTGHSLEKNYKAAIAAARQHMKDGMSNDFLGLFFDEYELGGGRLAPLFTATMRDKIDPDMDNNEVKRIIRNEVDDAVENSFNVLRTRIDRFGVVQPNIQKLGNGRILIELPGIKEPKRVEKLLQGSANLEFWDTYYSQELFSDLQTIESKLAEEEQTLVGLFSESIIGRDKTPVIGVAHYSDTARINAILQSHKADLPSLAHFCWEVKAIDDRGMYFRLIALKRESTRKGPRLEGDVITDARADFQQNGHAEVLMKMNAAGARKWAEITKKAFEEDQKSVAIVLDGFVYSFPNVQSEITGGSSSITGHFTMDEAKDLANTLKSGKMPAPARIIQSDVVGPSLGQEAIRAGLLSFLLGFILILVYMIFYYGWIPGLIADAALVCNLFLLVGILASFNAVLTLPGIAGIVLTMGMAVDANVLIYERIREELRGGKGMRKAVEDGFKGAISAIVDANVTSFLTGAILAYFGTGPIKGFAVTYMIGIISSFLTAVFITRLLLDDYCKRENAKELSFTTPMMKNFLQNIHFDFVKARKWAYCLSGALVIFAILGLEPHVFGKLNLGIDFSGGRNYVVRFDNDQIETQKVRENLNEVFKADAKVRGEEESFSLNVITFGNNANQVRVSTNYLVNEDDVDDLIDQLLYDGCKPFMAQEVSFDDFSSSEKNPEVGIMQSQKVGPSIADDIKTSAIWAIFAALIGIFIYILIRFRNFAYSVGALAALAHDTVIILGLYAILWKIMPFSMEIDQAFIAAILTVIGYSINDTVVIFDRVREYNKLYPKREKNVNINDALNNTLSRTFSTSMSTFVVLLAIFIFGGETIQGFVFALLMGVIVGTYSSLFIASPIAYDIQRAIAKRKEKKEALKK